MNLILLHENDFVSGNIAEITGRRAEHINNVHKALPGKELSAGLINSKMGKCKVVEITENKVTLSVNLRDNPPAPLPLTLIVALPRPKSLKKVIHVSTSLGIKRIFFIETWKVDKSYWKSPVLDKKEIDEHVYTGLEQAKDTVMPEINFRRRFKPFLEDEIPELVKGTLPLVAHPYGSIQCPSGVKKHITLAIGPEGGFTDYEIEMFSKYGFTKVTTGERIQRVEFAIPLFTGRLF